MILFKFNIKTHQRRKIIRYIVNLYLEVSHPQIRATVSRLVRTRLFDIQVRISSIFIDIRLDVTQSVTNSTLKNIRRARLTVGSTFRVDERAMMLALFILDEPNGIVYGVFINAGIGETGSCLLQGRG